MKEIVVTGATGIVGKPLTQLLISKGYNVTVFTTSASKAENTLPGVKKYVQWSAYDMGKWMNEVEGKDAVIHLAGESIFGQLWSDEYKEKVMKSREDGTYNVVEAIAKADKRPTVFISASAIGYYGFSENIMFDEDSPAGEGFLAEVSKKWEKEAERAELFGLRRVSVRVGIVLDKSEGALDKILTPFKYFLGGTVGEGNQWISWIHNLDCANLFIHALENRSVKGALNAVAPKPVKMKEFSDTLAEVLNRPAVLEIPKFILENLYGEASVPVTEGIKVFPKKALETGYKFRFTELKEALKNLL